MSQTIMSPARPITVLATFWLYHCTWVPYNHNRERFRTEYTFLCPAPPDFCCAIVVYEQGTANTLMRYNTADNSVPTPVEEFGDGQADTADEAPPPPFFVCEHYTPESTCFVSARGVAYTTIIIVVHSPVQSPN